MSGAKTEKIGDVDQLSAEQIQLNIWLSDYHAEVDAFCESVVRSPEHGLTRDPRANCPWVVKLANMFERHAAKLPAHLVVPYAALAGDRMIECQEYDLAHRCCYQMVIHGGEADLETRLRCRVGSSYCLARTAQRKDPGGRNRETVDHMLGHSLEMIRCCAKAPASLAWVVMNSSVLVYQLAMDLLTWGFAKEAGRVLSGVLDELIAPSAVLCSPPHLGWRLQLCTVLAFCHEECRDRDAFGALVDSALALWAKEDPALGATPSQQRSQAKKLGDQLPVLVQRAKGLRMLRFKHNMLPIEPAPDEPPSEEADEPEELSEEALQGDMTVVQTGLRENFSTWQDQLLALSETLTRPWRRTVMDRPTSAENRLRVASILLAAQPLVSEGYKDPLGTFETNIMGTAHVLEAARQCGTCEAVVCITTDKVYLNAEDGRQFIESDRLGGRDPYSSSKVGAEMVALSYMETLSPMANNVQIGIARGGNIVGGGDWSDDRIIPDFVRALRGRHSLSIRQPDAVRPWQHVLCLVHGYLCLGAHLLSGGGSGHWNFGPSSDDMRTVYELVETLSALWDAPTIDFNKSTLKEARLLLLSSEKARRELGWEPAIHFPQCMQLTADWYNGYYSNEQDVMSLCTRQISQYRGKLLDAHAA